MIAASLFHTQVIDHCHDFINPSHIQSLPTFTIQTTSNPESNKQKQKQTTQHSLRQRRRPSDPSTIKEYKNFERRRKDKSSDSLDYDWHDSDSSTYTSSTTSNTSELSTSSNTSSPSDSSNYETTNTNTKGYSNKIVYRISKVLVVYNFAMVYTIMFIIIVGTAIIATERGIESMMPDTLMHHHHKDGNADNIANRVGIDTAAAAAAAADIASTIVEPREQLVAELVYIIKFIIIGGTTIIATERGIESMMPDTLMHHHHKDGNADNIANRVGIDTAAAAAAAADIASTIVEPREQLVAELVYIIKFIIIGGTTIIATERGIESMVTYTLMHRHHKDGNTDNVANHVDIDIAAAADISSTIIEPRQQLVANRETLLEKLKLPGYVGSFSSPEDEVDEDVVLSLSLSSRSMLPLCFTIFLSIPKFLVCLLHHVRFQIFRSDATMHGDLINDGDLPVVLVTTESNRRLPQTNSDNNANFRFNEDVEKGCACMGV